MLAMKLLLQLFLSIEGKHEMPQCLSSMHKKLATF